MKQFIGEPAAGIATVGEFHALISVRYAKKPAVGGEYVRLCE
jgi:hypothetical protein